MKAEQQTEPIVLTGHQRHMIDAAIQKCREWTKEDLDEGRALEIIAFDFLESFSD